MRQKATEFRLGRSKVKTGDFVKVKPSAPGLHDGFTAKVIDALVDGDETVEVTVYGGPGRRVMIRTLYPHRVSPMRQSTQERVAGKRRVA